MNFAHPRKTPFWALLSGTSLHWVFFFLLLQSPSSAFHHHQGAQQAAGPHPLHMESALPGPGCVEDGKASQQQEELPQPEEEKLQGEMENGSYDEQEMEETVQEEDEDDDGMEEDESCASSSMHAVATTGQMNGEGAAAASLKTNSKSPVNRTGRRNQEVKDRSNFICPLCDKNCLTQHQLTMHIRQHNTEVGGTDHSCSICGKALSSASSLDRHMLVHSGERPYKCTVCGQTFTTNGNMHRHMKIHDKDATGAPASRPTSPNKRRKAKRKLSIEEDVEKMDEPPSKKVFLMQQPEEQIPAVKREEDLLHCPICFKTFICKYGLESHMETHPDTALRCNQCCITFRTHRGLLRHNSVIHKQLPTDPTGRPFIQTNPSIPLGFSDLSFIDFSCHKFPQIAQVWCETNLRRCSSKFHRFVCEVCNKAFPLQVSLDLHTTSHKDSKNNCAELQKQEDDTNSEASKDGSDSADSKEVAESVLKEASGTVNGKTDFMESLGLQLSSLAKSEQSEEEIQQGILDSIRFIRVEPSATNLPQETNSSLGLCFLNPVSIQGLNKGNGLSLVSLQPLQGGLVVQPVGQNGVELADIQQILKLATSVPPQVHLLPNAPGSPLQTDTKQITPLRPKPLVTPRSSMGVSTPPPPVMNAQQASSGCISPNLPPPAAQQLLTSKQSSNTLSSSTSSSPTNWESSHVGGDCIGMTGITAYNSSTGNIKQKEGQVNKKYVKTSGGKKTEYPCRFCSEVFSFPGGLQAHMRARHSGASPYKCSVCPYAAPDNATLMRHLRIHSGERPYVCRLCHYPFTVKANCERHLRKKHMKNSRKDIEKNIEYVTTSTNVSDVIGGTTLDLLESAGVGSTSCRYCGEDLKSYRALQIHLRTLNGCQRKPFECRQCGAAFLAKRNCILHLLKEHSEIPERDIEEHINTLVPLTAASPVQANPVVPDGPLPSIQPQADKQDLSTFTEAAEQDEPLDFSKKTSKTLGSDIQPEAASASVLSLDDCSMEPIDLSMPKNPEGKKARTGVALSTSLLLQEIKKDVTYLSTDKSSVKMSGVHATLPVSIPSIDSTLPSDLAKSSTRLKPLRPKPIAIANTSEMPPLASIAQIISSVSATPVLFKKGIKTEKCDRAMSSETLTDKKCSNGTVSPEYSFAVSSPETSKKRGKKKPFKEEKPTEAPVSEIDMESSEEFPSVEKMLATTDANKFSPYLQPRQVEPEPYASEEEKEGKEGKQKVQPQSKGKKNAYSNSVQKMKCPYCPRVFPWTSSLQRHMLTHTGQKPFPCPQCDAFFSTKSNCERHLLRKHGVSSRSTVQNTGLHPKPKSDEGSQGSTEHFSDTGDAVGPKAEEETMNETVLPEQSKEQPESQKDLEISQATDSSKNNEGNKGLDINIASKLTESKPSGTEHHKPETKEPVLEQVSSASDEFPHTCGTCKKTFRHAATLIRHQKIHIQDRQTEERDRKMRPAGSSQPISANNTPGKEVKQETGAAENEENSSSIMESGTEDDEKEERNDDEECGSSEFRGLEEENESAGGRSDKRKKVCTMCTKRFWSLQDLTRHMRSHTGERPYQCQTCDRTFTLKHSLVRHQRIHQKAPDGRGADRSDDPDEADGARDDSAGEELRGSSGSESEAPSTASSEGGNAQEAEHQMVDKTGTKEEVSTEATEEPQAKEDNPEPKETADPQYNQGAPDV